MYKKKIAEISAEADAIRFTYINGEKKYNPLTEGSVEYTRFKELIELIHSLEEKQRIFDQSENMKAVKDYIILDAKSYARIAGVPAKIAKSLPVGYGFVDLNRYTPQLCCGWDKPHENSNLSRTRSHEMPRSSAAVGSFTWMIRRMIAR